MKLNIEKTRQKLNQSADGVSIDLEHIKNEHSDIQSEIKIGQKARTANDLILIPYLLNNFDEAKLSPKHDDNLGNRAITIKKQINGVSVIGTIERGKNGVYVVTHWQTVSAAPMSQAPGRNVLNDADKYKIQQDIAKIKSDAENSSKIVDKNGEPLVVYHGSQSRFTVFDSNRGTNIEAIWHTSDFAIAAHFGSGSITRFDESLSERFENVRSLSELSSFAKRELGINVAITTQNISVKEAKEYGVSPGIRYYMESEYPVGGSVSAYLSGAKNDANALQKAKENLLRAIYKSINPESQGFTYANYLRIQNPLEVDAKGTPYHSILFKKKKLNTESIATIAKKHGHDGVIIRNGI